LLERGDPSEAQSAMLEVCQRKGRAFAILNKERDKGGDFLSSIKLCESHNEEASVNKVRENDEEFPCSTK